MSDKSIEYFVADVFDEVQKRYKESQIEMVEHKDDAFISGRALAYHELYEIIQNRMKIYGIAMERGSPDGE